VGIVAIDPSSPYSGGSILGDRVRMTELANDPGVFIRSMATRGATGGMARAALDAVDVLDIAGFHTIIIETVGVGQDEVEIAKCSDTTIVVSAPGLGDEIQAIKAGILEIADILIVNKADRPGASNTVRALRTMIETGHPAIRTRWMHHGQMLHVDERQPAPPADTPLWIPPIIETVATEARGIDLLLAQVQAHRQFLLNSPLRTEIERTQMHSELLERLRDALAERLLSQLPTGALDALVTQVLQRQRDPGHAVAELIALAGHPVAQTR
jgi:LAO/AO transport system kinase